MPHELPKAYEPSAIEARWAEYWVREKLFHVPTPQAGSPAAQKPVFTLLLPPPNVTGRLHMGHMLNQTQMDIIVRWHRMRGFLTLWLPGTDHAGIATQIVVERQLQEQGISRHDMGPTPDVARKNFVDHGPKPHHAAAQIERRDLERQDRVVGRDLGGSARRDGDIGAWHVRGI